MESVVESFSVAASNMQNLKRSHDICMARCGMAGTPGDRGF